MQMKKKPYPLEEFFGRVLDPFERFLKQTSAGGIVLLAAIVFTLALANSPWGPALSAIWGYPLRIRFHEWQLTFTFHQFINEGLMTLFFLFVGLELKRAFIVGELSSPKRAALPVIGAIGGMAVPAAIYFSLNPAGDTSAGWGIPMATDIAFAVGILVMLARRVPRSLIVFLTALAIADDLGAVLVIAIFYTRNLNLAVLAFAALAMGGLIFLNLGGIRRIAPYALLGVFLWYGLLESIAGVLLAFVVPARPVFSSGQFARRLDELREMLKVKRKEIEEVEHPLKRSYQMETIAGGVEEATHAVQSPLQRMEHLLAPWVTFAVIPVFALANAGIDFSGLRFSPSHSCPVTAGIVFGLVFGKFLGIGGISWLAIRAGVAQLPPGARLSQIFGAAWLGGIGFTMSLFVSELAFSGNAVLLDAAKTGVLIASPIASVIGLAWLYFVSRDQDLKAGSGWETG
jgi:NhaA family Na+:H+ antiporter